MQEIEFKVAFFDLKRGVYTCLRRASHEDASMNRNKVARSINPPNQISIPCAKTRDEKERKRERESGVFGNGGVESTSPEVIQILCLDSHRPIWLDTNIKGIPRIPTLSGSKLKYYVTLENTKYGGVGVNRDKEDGGNGSDSGSGSIIFAVDRYILFTEGIWKIQRKLLFWFYYLSAEWMKIDLSNLHLNIICTF